MKFIAPPIQNVLRAGLWFGLLTGFVEVCCFGVLRFAFDQPIYFGAYIIWLTPLANVVIFVLLALALLLAARRRPQWMEARARLTYFSFFTLLSWSLLGEFAKPWAKTLFVAGAAFQLGRWLAPRAATWRGFVVRSAQVMVTLVIVVAIAADEWQHLTRERTLAALPAAAADAPNVLFIVMDNVRARDLSLYGYHRATTPRLDQFAQAGVCFEMAIATAPWTLPSHASMFTGRWPHELSTGFRTSLNRQHLTLAEALRARGYATAGFVANNFYCNRESGLARGFIDYEDYRLRPSEALLSASLSRAFINHDLTRHVTAYHNVVNRKDAAAVNYEFFAWLKQRPTRPFFAFLNYLDAHEPCQPPAPFAGHFGVEGNQQRYKQAHLLRTSWRLRRERETAEELQSDINCYDSSIAYLDHQIGALLDELKGQNLLQNTLVVITSDHGEAFGENGHFGHTDSAYLTQLHVPLLLVFPSRVPAGARPAEPVSLRDLAATVMDLLAPHAAPLFPGQSLASHWNGHNDTSQPLLSEVDIAPLRPQQYRKGERALVVSLLNPSFHYLKEPDGSEKLYDYRHDPDELLDLSHDSAWRNVMNIFSTARRYQTGD